VTEKSILTIQNLQVWRDGISILDGVHLDISPNEIVCVLGGSGSGKTTLLLAIAGLLEQSSQLKGHILLRGQSMKDVPPHRRGVPLVLQELGLFEHLTVIKNVAYGLQVKGLPSKEALQKSMAALKPLGITNLAKRLPSTLSTGQKQRVALARALVLEPELVMLDEPTSALDAATVTQFADLLKELRDLHPFGALIATHDRNLASSVADRVAVLNQGRLIQIGSFTEVGMYPQTLSVARLVGHRNIFLYQQDGETLIVGNSLRLNGVCIPDKHGPWLLLREDRIMFSRSSSDGISLSCTIRNMFWNEGLVRLELDVQGVRIYTLNTVENTDNLRCGECGFLHIRDKDLLFLEE